MSDARIVRGSWQRYVFDSMTSGYTRNPLSELEGRARRYAGRYTTSFFNMVERAEASGYHCDVIFGPRGGMWTAQIRLVRG